MLLGGEVVMKCCKREAENMDRLTRRKPMEMREIGDRGRLGCWGRRRWERRERAG